MSFPGGASGKELDCKCRRPEMWVWSLSREDPLKEGMATRFINLAWRIPMTEKPGGLHSPKGCKDQIQLKWFFMHVQKLECPKPNSTWPFSHVNWELILSISVLWSLGGKQVNNINPPDKMYFFVFWGKCRASSNRRSKDRSTKKLHIDWDPG